MVYIDTERAAVYTKAAYVVPYWALYWGTNPTIGLNGLSPAALLFDI